MTTNYIVPDLLQPGLDLVFCGTAPSTISAKARAYYANPGNQFWPALHRCGLIPAPIEPWKYAQLLEHGIGLTDLCKTHSGNDDELPRGSLNPVSVEEKILRYQPKIVAFTSKNAGAIFLKRHKVEYGFQPEKIGTTRLFVLSSSSGRARRFWREDVWCALAAHYQAQRKRSADAA